jgi:hypothetical protein
MINLNSNSSTELNLNINWPLPFYYIIFSTLFYLLQWVPCLWLFFAINARNFNVAREVGKKGEDVTYYGVPLHDYLNLARLQLFMLIIVWEVGVVGKRSQGVWTTCLIPCQSILSRIFLEIIHSNAFENNLQRKKNLKLGQLLKDLFIISKRLQRKMGLI